MQTMTFTAITFSGQAFDIDFPLHAETRSGQGVSGMVTALLESLSRNLASTEGLSDGDVLQALTMTLAIRGRVVDARPEAVQGLVRELCDTAFEATWAAKAYAAGRD